MRRSSRHILQETAQRVRNSFTQPPQTMDKFHTLMALIDKNAEVLPNGDYLEMANLLKEIRDKVKPPSFLLDQNEPMTMPEYEPTSGMHQNVTIDLSALHADWANERYVDYDEDGDEDDDVSEHPGYRFNTVPDTLDIDEIPDHVYNAIMSSRGPVTTRRLSEGDRDSYYEVVYPNGTTSTFSPERAQNFETIHR